MGCDPVIPNPSPLAPQSELPLRPGARQESLSILTYTVLRGSQLSIVSPFLPETAIARCFAFVGPHLPLDTGFAAGNFIRDALRGGPIQVKGDGTPRRSYLYAADLAAWLWTILVEGRPGRAYNVGSDADLSIRELADEVRKVVAPQADVTVAKQPEPGKLAERYVPDITRARTDLRLGVWISLQDAIARTVAWRGQSRLGA